MESEEMDKYFGVADFAVFFGVLLLSAAIGLFFGIKDRGKKSIDSYYFGDRDISPFPVGMSIAVSFVSAITIIGYPVETYLYGVVFLWLLVANVITTIIGAVYHIPIILRLRLNSIYEYLELRYNKGIRSLCSGIIIFNSIMYMGVTVYLPALALEVVTPLNLTWTIVLTSIVCTFYTTLGGVKAVVWTDVLQAFVMMFGSLALFIQTTIEVGGLGKVMEASMNGGRLNLFKSNFDIRERTSILSFGGGLGILFAASTCCNQVVTQRYMSCKSVNDARKALTYRIIPVTIFMLLAAACGLAMYAYYKDCDPYIAGYIDRQDQASAFLASEVFQSLPGLSGLFVSAAYSGTLSTVSSGINSLATLITEDFIVPRWPNISDKIRTITAKISSILLGVLVMGVAFAVSLLNSTIIQISLAFGGIFSGPILTAYTLGMFFPWNNNKGCVAGLVIGWTVTAWWFIGRIIYGVSPEFSEHLPLSTDGCYVNSTFHYAAPVFANATVALSTEEATDRPPLADTLYSISPILYGLVGWVISTLVMIIVSGLTGFNKPSDMDPKLFVPLIDNKKIFPKGVIKFFRFGVSQLEEKNAHESENFELEEGNELMERY